MKIRRTDIGEIFYYHPNHLSSTMYVTDMQQSVVQSFLYAPYGEIISEYNTHAMGEAFSKYSFNAKELDEETGMYYYEARYYAPPVFTSRDPLFEKYFWMSPYAYCANNPVKYVDPSGRKIIIVCPETGKKVKYKPEMSVPKRSSKFVSDAITGLNFLYKNPEGDKNRVADIVKAEPVLTIIQQSIGESSRYNPNNQTLSWDNQSIDVYETGSQSAIVGFAHEIDHASISIPALDRVWKYEDGVLRDEKAYIQDCGDAKLVTLPGDMKYENSAISYENFIGNLSFDNRKLSTYFRSSYIPPKETIRTNSIFMTNEK